MRTVGKSIVAVACAVSLGLTATGCDFGEPEREERTVETTENDLGDAVSFVTNSDAYKLATGIASLVGGWPQQAIGIVGNILQVAGILGTFGGESGLSSAISQQLSTIQRLTEETLAAVLVGDDLDRERESRAIVEEAITWVQVVRDDLASGREVAGQLTTPTQNDLNQATRFAVETLAGDEYWQRAYAASAVQGEWTYRNSRRPETSNGRVFEFRSIMPFYMHAVAARVLAIGIMEPDFVARGYYSGELQGYANFLKDKLARIEDGIACSFVGYHREGCDDTFVWGRLRAVCGSIYTNEMAEVTRDGKIGFPAGNGTCRDEDSRMPASWVLESYFDFGDVDDHWANGLDDARQKLRRQLAIFDIRHMIDNLERMAANAPDLIRPDTFQLMSWGFADMGRALQLAGTGPLEPGQSIPVIVGDSNDTGQAAAQSWSYDAVTGRIWHVGEFLAGRGWYCLDGWGDGNTRNGAAVTVKGCQSDAEGRVPPWQRWTFNYQTGILFNGNGRVLDIAFGDPTPGNGVWLWDENHSAAQLWGW